MPDQSLSATAAARSRRPAGDRLKRAVGRLGRVLSRRTASEALGSAGSVRPTGSAIVYPGANCETVVRARRGAVLIDGAEYFGALEQSLRQARHSIFILGWDFDGRIRLRHDAPAEESPPLGMLLRSLVEEKPGLVVNILIWSESVVHAPSAIGDALFGVDWQNHPRIRIVLDTHHPFYAAHHQKIVCIDGSVAFAGGIDLTVGRWDRCAHQIGDPLRIDPDGKAYGPVHDVQMVVDGHAAQALCAIAGDRWQAATGDTLPESCSNGGHDPWPAGVSADFTDVDVAVARTVPEYGSRQGTAEAMRLTLDALAAAEHTIYIEAQYMTASVVGDVLVRQLGREDGPEMVVVMTHSCDGFVEQLVMGTNRDRLVRRLRHADRYGRLRVHYPYVTRNGKPEPVYVHSKTMVVDDRFLRVGSSNLNNRSIGLDTECDLAIEAGSERERKAIAAVRDRLISEHLDIDQAAFADAVRQEGSLIAVIDRYAEGERGLAPFEAMSDDGPSRPLFGSQILDPARPFRISRLRG